MLIPRINKFNQVCIQLHAVYLPLSHPVFCFSFRSYLGKNRGSFQHFFYRTSTIDTRLSAVTFQTHTNSLVALIELRWHFFFQQSASKKLNCIIKIILASMRGGFIEVMEVNNMNIVADNKNRKKCN